MKRKKKTPIFTVSSRRFCFPPPLVDSTQACVLPSANKTLLRRLSLDKINLKSHVSSERFHRSGRYPCGDVQQSPILLDWGTKTVYLPKGY